MLGGKLGNNKTNSLMSEYASLLGDAVLRRRTRVAEHSARIEAELASKVKSEFISNMSHELRTPLNTVLGFSKLLMEHRRRPLGEQEIVEYSSLINNAASQLLSIINDILDISKIQSGKYTIDAREVSLDEVLQVCISGFKAQAQEAGVVIEQNLLLDLPSVKGDPAKLSQIFNHLIGNALKFNRKGGTVMVEGHRSSNGGATVLIRDSGIGMSEEELRLALTPFGQVDGSRSRWREGAGLGLPIAKSLVELHGGTIEIRSIKGQGTAVAVLLPSRHNVEVAQDHDAVAGRASAGYSLRARDHAAV